jgi:predicted acylesterase/phospholipase RssA
MNIKHLVISGGGHTMIQTLGALHYLSTNKIINLNNIQSIYGTSAGAIVGILICLKYDWESINDYILQRPWNDVFKIKIDIICDAYKKKGLFDIKTFEKCFKPLFDAKDISMNITLKEFYDYSNIALHMYSFDINEFKLQDISYITYPDLPLLQGLQMTCSLPLLVSPVCIDDKCFIDGGIICNYPLKQCIENVENTNEILGFKNQYNNENKLSMKITSESTILDYMLTFLFKSIQSLGNQQEIQVIENEIICNSTLMSVNYLKEVFSSMELRKSLFDNGSESAKLFISKIDNKESNENDKSNENKEINIP